MNKIYLIGDLHGNYTPIKNFYDNYKDTENFDGSDIMITLGDLGSLYYFDNKKELSRERNLKKKLSEYPFTYYNVRGNHEQRPSLCAEKAPAAWTITEEFGGIVYYENDFTNIKYFCDGGGNYNINGKKVLIIPGAYSPDKE